jgi:hypothetical protein
MDFGNDFDIYAAMHGEMVCLLWSIFSSLMVDFLSMNC